ncbi:hypothetical protein [Deinococcus pimensis]|uniref:hypothetical protein n=1 Tax=Deinococcus pimensis TaxID=309888 RepID=UPI000483663F
MHVVPDDLMTLKTRVAHDWVLTHPVDHLHFTPTSVMMPAIPTRRFEGRGSPPAPCLQPRNRPSHPRST